MLYYSDIHAGSQKGHTNLHPLLVLSNSCQPVELILTHALVLIHHLEKYKLLILPIRITAFPLFKIYRSKFYIDAQYIS